MPCSQPAFRPLAAAILAAGLLASPAAASDEMSMGAEEYRNACASCHGADGKGDGPLAEIMTVDVPDLTQIAARNDGVFPVQEVFMIIDGRTGVRGHGYPMPVWGARFKAQEGATWGPFGAEEVVRARILSLVYHLHGLQAPAE